MAFWPKKQKRTAARKSRRRSGKSSGDFRLALFGVVNSGKTSLARALFDEPDFGHVSIVPGSTKTAKELSRKVKYAQSSFTVVDTPGVEGFYGLVSEFKEASEALEERDWLQRFDAWWAERLASLGPADTEAPTVEHRFEDAYKAMRNAKALCLVHKGSDVLQENVREDVAALMEVVRRIRKPCFSVLKDACSEAFATHSGTWKEFSESLGVHQIVVFDSHRRRLVHVNGFFKALEEVLPVSQRGDKAIVARVKKQLLLPESRKPWKSSLAGLVAMTWQGVAHFNPLASRDPVSYLGHAEKAVQQHIALCVKKSRVPKHVKEAVNHWIDETVAGELTSENAVVVENSLVGGVWPAFYVRLKPEPAARLIAAVVFLHIEVAVWGGGQGSDPSAWDEVEFNDRMDDFVKRYGKRWAGRLKGSSANAGDATSFEELVADVIRVVETHS
jgi:hypothetical protein